MKKAQEIGNKKPIMEIMPFKHKKVGIVTTGSEVFHGRIKDTFGPVIIEKLEEFNAEILGQEIVNDHKEDITNAIISFIEKGADIVVCTGGMSVDPDDCTPGAIKDTGAEIITYGAPVLPGAMLLVSYYDYNGKKVPVLGLPGCVMYANATDAASNENVEVKAEAPEGSVSKVIYPVGIIKDSANLFTDFLQSEEALKIFESYGFTANK